MNKDYRKIIREEFEKTFKIALNKRNEINSAANLYLQSDGLMIRIPATLENDKHMSMCWDRDNFVFYGYLDSFCTKNKKICFNSNVVKINLLQIDPEKTKFIVESQGYLKVKKTKSLPKKLRLAIRAMNSFQDACITVACDRQADDVA